MLTSDFADIFRVVYMVYSLVTTDLMTRGIDVEDVSAVISYDSPPYLETYVHRVGRTARAGKPGLAYTILHTKEVCS